MEVKAAKDVLIGGAQIVAATVTSPVGRGRYNRWGATDAEVAGQMPGDDLIAEPKLGYTRAISINVPVQVVWPWLVQIGQSRGGLYSFDGLENVVGCDIHSANAILPHLQALDAGDLIRLGPPGYPCFRVQRIDPPRSLVLVAADPKPPHDAAASESPGGFATWQWELRPKGADRSTRLLVRQRLTYPPVRSASLLWHVVEPIGFVMERQMLRGIKQRAEAGH